MDLTEATLADVQRDNPALLKSITDHVTKQISESEETKKKDLEEKAKLEASAAGVKKTNALLEV